MKEKMQAGCFWFLTILIGFFAFYSTFCGCNKPVYANTPSSFSVGESVGSPGEIVQIPVLFQNGQPQIQSVSFDLKTPEDMAFVQAILSQEAQGKYKQLRIDPVPGGAHISIISLAKHPYYKASLFNDGVLMVMTLFIRRDPKMGGPPVKRGLQDVILSNIIAISADGKPVSMPDISGIITVTD